MKSDTLDEIDDLKQKQDMKILEAIFFVSGRFLTMPELVTLSDLNPVIIPGLIEKIQEKYNTEDFALEIVKKGGFNFSSEEVKQEKNEMWKMDVKPAYTYLINKLATGSAEFSNAEQETLAIIAFKQPIKQSVIIKIRGNKAYDHIKKFKDLDLIKKKKQGHTYELSLSADFYDYFNVESETNNLLKEKNSS
ncbi:SMC-Scp complex subunit ScpB [Candidatus Pacearchaeota archaeon]|nr:SMC-Scp complex subunit ScpB [Candidatus Pacearchaeota archaeon]